MAQLFIIQLISKHNNGIINATNIPLLWFILMIFFYYYDKQNVSLIYYFRSKRLF